jgi:hypothetical protein
MIDALSLGITWGFHPNAFSQTWELKALQLESGLCMFHKPSHPLPLDIKFESHYTRVLLWEDQHRNTESKVHGAARNGSGVLPTRL